MIDKLYRNKIKMAARWERCLTMFDWLTDDIDQPVRFTCPVDSKEVNGEATTDYAHSNQSVDGSSNEPHDDQEQAHDEEDDR